jgi:hypothetical protein
MQWTTIKAFVNCVVIIMLILRTENKLLATCNMFARVQLFNMIIYEFIFRYKTTIKYCRTDFALVYNKPLFLTKTYSQNVFELNILQFIYNC